MVNLRSGSRYAKSHVGFNIPYENITKLSFKNLFVLISKIGCPETVL